MRRFHRKFVLLLAVSATCSAQHARAADFSQVPGTVLDWSPASSGVYLGSPSIAILPDGSYVASHDTFGAISSPTTSIFRSTDRGVTWTKISSLSSTQWSNLFVYQGNLYLMGTNGAGGYGNLQIRKSTDNGATWTTPTGSTNGLLKAATSFGYHTAPVPIVVANGRIWRAFEDTGNGGGWPTQFRSFVMSAPIGADLLNASSWTYTNPTISSPNWLPNNAFNGFLEGNVVADASGNIHNLLRIDNQEKAASITISSPTQASFNPNTDIVDLPGGATKFDIRYDSVSGQYWALSNPLVPGYDNLSPAATRNTLAVISSPDLSHWKINQIVDFNADANYHAFQYPDWQIDGSDMIAALRTAYDDGVGGANSYHNSNFTTFQRIPNFRTNIPTRQVLLADTNNNRVMRYDVVNGAGGPWLLNPSVALSGSVGSATLSTAFGLAQDAAGRIYVGEQKDGGRILALAASGQYQSTVATEGVNFTGRPEAMTLGPDGNIYFSVAFGTNSDKVYKLDITTGVVSNFATGVSLSDPRGIAFASDGNLYVADRNNNRIRKFAGATGQYLGDLANAPSQPQGLSWDEKNNQLLATGTTTVGATNVVALSLNGDRTNLAGLSRNPTLIDAANIAGSVFYSDYSDNLAGKIGAAGQSTTAVDSISGPGHLLELTNQQAWIGGRSNPYFGSDSSWTKTTPSAVFDGSAALIFSGTIQPIVTNDVPNALVAGITFSASAGSFQLNGGSITLQHIGGGIVNDSTRTQTVNVSAIWMTAQPIDAAVGDIAIQSPIGVSGLLVVMGTHATYLNGALFGAGRIEKRDSGTLALAGSNAMSGGLHVAAGDVIVNTASALSDSQLTIESGALVCASAQLGPAIHLADLEIGGGGSFDLTDNALVIDGGESSTLQSITSLVTRGRGSGDWTGDGLTSSTAAAIATAPQALHKTGIGIALAADLGVSSFAGVATAPDSLLVRYTLLGDANLDGTVNTADFTALAGAFGQQNSQWASGDFNYDGVVNALDFNAIAANFGFSVPDFEPSMTLVPEPANSEIIGLFALATCARFRRLRKQLARTSI